MAGQINITLHPLGTKVKVNAGTPLVDVLHEFGVEFPCGSKGICGACKVKLLKGELAMDRVQEERLKKLRLQDNWRLACFCKAESDITLEISQLDNIILADNSKFEFIPKEGYGIAVDVGSTTIVAQLLNLQNAHIIDSVSEVNPQTKFGADLIARIQSCLEGKQSELQQMVREKIGEMISSMLIRHKVKVSDISLVGNTVMHHIFSGLSVEPLSVYPFDSPHLEAKRFLASELKWQIPENAKIQFYPSIGSFVGSDILAGIAATKMAQKESYTILVDLGTNGEIAIGNSDKIVCTSTAAGPAFEGANITHGMRATTGAISSVKMHNNELDYHVIGNVKAKGICGSGLVDLLAILLDKEAIGMFGEILSGEDEVKIGEKVSLTQSDIREFQLAKAAFATGIELLLNELEIKMDSIENIYIAGGFGNFLNLKNVIRTGLLEAPEDKMVKLGNSALIGAKMFLFQDKKSVENILQKTVNINLEGQSNFQDVYVDKMLLI